MALIGTGRRDRFPKEDARLRRGLATTAFVPFIGANLDVDLGAHTITATQFISSIATGTAPFVVTSTTVVTNLNADLLDGFHESHFVTDVTGTAPIVSSGGQTPAISITAADATHAGSVPLSGTPATNVFLRATITTGAVSWQQIASADVSGYGTFGTLVLAGGSITDTTGAISFGNENLTTTGSGTFGTAIVSSLTSGRIPFASSAGLLIDSALLGYAVASGQLQIGNDTVNPPVRLSPLAALTLTQVNAALSSGAGSLFVAPEWQGVGSATHGFLWYCSGTAIGRLDLFTFNISTTQVYYTDTSAILIGYDNATSEDIAYPGTQISVKNRAAGSSKVALNPGTVSVTGGSAVVTGVGTQFTKSFVPGSTGVALTGLGGTKTVSTITSDTVMTMTTNYSAPLSGVTYGGSRRVIGDGFCLFTTEFQVGDILRIGDYNTATARLIVASITDDNLLVVSSTSGTWSRNLSGQSYVNATYDALSVIMGSSTGTLASMDARIILNGAVDDGVTALQLRGDSVTTGVATASNFVSSVATGTQPYACTSTTVNTNLNADMADGYHFDQEVKQASNVKFAGISIGASAGIDATVPVAPVLPLTVAGSMTFTKGILTAYTAPS